MCNFSYNSTEIWQLIWYLCAALLSKSWLDWVLSHWVHFTVHSLDLVVFICVYFVFFHTASETGYSQGAEPLTSVICPPLLTV